MTSPTPFTLTASQRGILARERSGAAPSEFVVGEVVFLGDFMADAAVVRRAVAAELAVPAALRLDTRGLDDADELPTELPLNAARPAVAVEGCASFHAASVRVREWFASPFAWHDGVFEAVVLAYDTGVALGLRGHHVAVDGYAMQVLWGRILRRLGAVAGSGFDAGAGFAAGLDAGFDAGAGFAAGLDAGFAALQQWHDRATDRTNRDRAAWAEHPLLTNLGEIGTSLLPLQHAANPTVHAPTRCDPAPLPCPDATQGALLEHGFTWAEVLLAAHCVTIARLTGYRVVAPAMPLNNRATPEQRECIVSAVNIAPCVVAVDPGSSPETLLKTVRAALRFTRKHGGYPLENLLRDRGLVTTPEALVGSELNILAFDALPELPGVSVTRERLGQGPVADISLNCVLTGDGARAQIEWHVLAPAGISREHIAGIGTMLGEVFTALCTHFESPVRDSNISLAELLAVADSPSNVATNPTPPETLPELWGHHAATHPERICLRSATDHFTALDINTLSAELYAAAQRLNTPTFVLLIDDRLQLAAAYLALLLAGITAVPLDPAAPASRRAAMLAHLGNPPIISQVTPLAIAAQAPQAPGAAGDFMADAAYVIHTSGSTGAPKPVGVTRAALEHVLAHHHKHWWGGGAQRLTVALTLPLTFDAGLDSLLAAMLGHEVFVVDAEATRDPLVLHEVCARQRVNAIDVPPTICAQLAELPPLADLQFISIGGEPTPPSVWQHLGSWATARLRNLYGPTETTIDATIDVFDGSVAGSETRCGSGIGLPLDSVRVSVLDAWLLPLPTGVTGELYVAGPQLAVGYLGMAGLTAQSFVADAGGTRRYRTGDIGFATAGSRLRFVGRRDSQVKVRGYRVDLGELERAAAAVAGVARAIGLVSGAGAGAGSGQLHLVVVPRDAHALTASSELGTPYELAVLVRQHLVATLPPYLVPTSITWIKQVPLTPNGKIDNEALLAFIRQQRANSAQTHAAMLRGRTDSVDGPNSTANINSPDGTNSKNGPGRPQSPAEQAVARAIATALDTPVTSAADDFFALGGDSITAIRVCSALRSAGYTVTVRQIFTHRTVTDIAAHATKPAETVARPTPTRSEGKPLLALGNQASAHLASVLARTNRQQ